jgi:hypothetical protein
MTIHCPTDQALCLMKCKVNFCAEERDAQGTFCSSEKESLIRARQARRTFVPLQVALD